jgi:hypothetical protein
MPCLPPNANANMLSNFSGHLPSWHGGGNIPMNGPHSAVVQQYGCTIKKDFSIQRTRSYFKKGMEGICVGEPEDGHVKIFIRGITESFQNGVWVENLWVPVSNVDRGRRHEPNINDWDIKMNMNSWNVEDSTGNLKATPPDTTVLGRTITRLIDEFHTNPAPFMGTKIQDLLDKRAKLGKTSTIASITKAIIQGIKDASLYTTLNKTSFTMEDILRAAKHTINEKFPQGKGGIYVRYHISSSGVTRWKPNTKYVYVGKSVDFKDRFDSHRSSVTSYGDLTRNSRELHSRVLCTMSETDVIDYAYLVEQIFVCLFETYRSDLHGSLTRTFEISKGIDHVEAVQAADYFKKVSEKVFAETRFPGAINRSSFGVSMGANYSMPFTEWARTKEQLLFLRHDTLVKDRVTGRSIPMSVFRRAKPKSAHYLSKSSGKQSNAYDEMYVFQKYRAGKHFFSVRHSQTVRDGTMGPMQDDPYQLVFEVRTDGQPHPNAWSRLPNIGGLINWDQARSLAVRIEWEFPAKSGIWKHRYLYAQNVYKFQDQREAGCHANYIKIIAMIQWLFDAPPNNPRPWMPRLKGCAYVLQTVYHYHTQTIEVKNPEPFTMTNGGHKKKVDIVNAMKAVGFDNVDDEPEVKKTCDGCAMLSTKALKSIGSKCVVVEGLDVCRPCLLFGRPCCSWTKNPAVKGMRAFSKGMIAGEIAHEGKVTSEDVALNKKFRAALNCQPLPESRVEGTTFTQQLIDASNLDTLEDDLSDVEDAEEEFEGSEGEDEE